jgi:hypothetical protein
MVPPVPKTTILAFIFKDMVAKLKKLVKNTVTGYPNSYLKSLP